MNPFHSTREAKEYLISRIVEEAQREGIVLSATERKMLYFSETAWTLPDMDTVSDEFDSAYNQRDYEKKIARLIRKVGKRVRKDSPAEYDNWLRAIRRLESEDHYLLAAGCTRRSLVDPENSGNLLDLERFLPKEIIPLVGGRDSMPTSGSSAGCESSGAAEKSGNHLCHGLLCWIRHG